MGPKNGRGYMLYSLHQLLLDASNKDTASLLQHRSCLCDVHKSCTIFCFLAALNKNPPYGLKYGVRKPNTGWYCRYLGVNIWSEILEVAWCTCRVTSCCGGLIANLIGSRPIWPLIGSLMPDQLMPTGAKVAQNLHTFNQMGNCGIAHLHIWCWVRIKHKHWPASSVALLACG